MATSPRIIVVRPAEMCACCGARVWRTFISPLDLWAGDTYPRYVCPGCRDEQIDMLAEADREESQERREWAQPL